MGRTRDHQKLLVLWLHASLEHLVGVFAEVERMCLLSVNEQHWGFDLVGEGEQGKVQEWKG